MSIGCFLRRRPDCQGSGGQRQANFSGGRIYNPGARLRLPLRRVYSMRKLTVLENSPCLAESESYKRVQQPCAQARIILPAIITHYTCVNTCWCCCFCCGCCCCCCCCCCCRCCCCCCCSCRSLCRCCCCWAPGAGGMFIPGFAV